MEGRHECRDKAGDARSRDITLVFNTSQRRRPVDMEIPTHGTTASVDINFCPFCGADLRKKQEQE